MTKESENIELRSEKVRNIIGQIPPTLIRTGIIVIFFVFVTVLACSYFFEYEYSIKTTATISAQQDSILILLKIPANQKEKIKKGQKVTLFFDNIPNMNWQSLAVELLEPIEEINISQEGAYYTSEFTLPEMATTNSGYNIKINGKITVKAEIQVGKIRFFCRIIELLKGDIKPAKAAYVR